MLALDRDVGSRLIVSLIAAGVVLSVSYPSSRCMLYTSTDAPRQTSLSYPSSIPLYIPCVVHAYAARRALSVQIHSI